MSRIGKLPISIPAGVTVSVNDENVVSVKGPKGEMSQAVHPSIKVEIVDYGCRCFRRLCEEVGTCGCGFPCQQSGQLD